MSTSGIYSVQYTRDQLITAGIRKLGVIAQGQTPNTQNISDGADALNMAVAYLRSKGMPLWARATYTFSTTPTIQNYTIGLGQTFNTQYPLHLYECVRIDQSGTRIDMDIESDYNFQILPGTSTGIPIKITYQPFVNYGVLKLWPIPDSTAAGSTFTITYQRPFQYFINSTDTADFPEEWYLPLIYKIATILAPEWGIPIGDRNMLMGEAEKYLEDVLSMGQEDASIFIQPYMQPGWGQDRRG
jgi:hypothetical protein